MKRKINGEKYITFKWLLTTILSASAGILLIVGGLANATFYSKSAGAATEVKVQGVQTEVADVKIMLQEVRQDVKLLIARKR